MKLGEEWLRDWINPGISNKKLCNQLINFGCEVEFWKEKKKYLSNVVIGQIISKTISNIDKQLILYQISFSKNCTIFITYQEKKYLLIGLKVPIILPFSVLHLDSKNISLDIYDNISGGSFGSYHLLEIEENNHEIIILSDHVVIGSNFNDYLSLYVNIMKIFIPFNRIDLRSIWGLSREIAILNNLPLPILKYSVGVKQKKICSNNLQVSIKNCNIQYMFCELHSIHIRSVLPFYIRERLRVANFLTDNIIFNIINYIFIETGHWFHVFDLDQLSHKLYINSLKKKTIIQDSHKKDIYLQVGTIILSDSENILSFEDMEYVNSGKVTLSTNNLFLGSVCFDANVMHNRSISIPTISRKIEYSKYNIYPDIQKNIFQYVQELILDICGGSSSKLQIYKNNNFSSPHVLVLNIKNLNKVSGMIFTNKEVISILNFCHFSFFEDKDNFFITLPYWRTDIRIVEELIGEIIRIYGCENIQSTPPLEYMCNALPPKKSISLSRIKRFLADRGYFEIISYSFLDPKIQKFFTKPGILKIKNPISNDMSDMRLSLWIGLLNCVAYNQKRQQESIRIFEAGLCFSSKKNRDVKIIQKEYLSAAISGSIGHRAWYSKNRKVDFYDLKGDLESILDLCGKLERIEFISQNFLGLCSKNSAGIYLSGQFIGCIGVLDSHFYNIFDLTDSVILFEIMWKKINDLECIYTHEISELPISKRDISIIVPDDILSQDILSFCRNTIAQNIDVYIYDVYKGLNIPLKKKSISLCFIFNSINKTLKDSDINSDIFQCIKSLEDKFGAILRD